MAQEDIGRLNQSQQLLSNRDLLLKNFKEVVDNLNDCEQFIHDVLDGKKKADADMGRLLEQCMSEFSSGDISELERLVANNFEDSLMIASLGKLQKQQLRINERLNTVFAESVIKS